MSKKKWIIVLFLSLLVVITSTFLFTYLQTIVITSDASDELIFTRSVFDLKLNEEDISKLPTPFGWFINKYSWKSDQARVVTQEDVKDDPSSVGFVEGFNQAVDLEGIWPSHAIVLWVYVFDTADHARVNYNFTGFEIEKLRDISVTTNNIDCHSKEFKTSFRVECVKANLVFTMYTEEYSEEWLRYMSILMNSELEKIK